MHLKKKKLRNKLKGFEHEKKKLQQNSLLFSYLCKYPKYWRYNLDSRGSIVTLLTEYLQISMVDLPPNMFRMNGFPSKKKKL